MGRLRKNSEASFKLEKCKNYIKNWQDFKGNWKEKVFKNNNELHIEIGSGKGKFIYELAKINPNINYVAIDKYETILLKLIKKENIELLNNLKIISLDATNINDCFANEEVNKIYLNFSDPWPKKRHSKRRLTSLNFINLYKEILDKKGLIEFKTDNRPFFDYSIEVIDENKFKKYFVSYDLHNEKNIDNIQTEYEIKFSKQNYKINKVIFCPFA